VLEERLSVRGGLHTLFSRRASLEWKEVCISRSIRRMGSEEGVGRGGSVGNVGGDNKSERSEFLGS
jgi:hypothetical protein